MSESTKVILTKFPEDIDSLSMTNISIGSGHGKIKKLKIVLSKSPIKASLRGIAIQRGGMTVCRYNSLPSSAPDDIRERIYGYCLLDDSLDEEMWSIELANHESFEARSAAWVKLRRNIDKICESFIQKHTKKREVTPPPLDTNEIIKVVNKLVEEHLVGLGKGGTGGGGGGEGTKLPPIHISPWGYLGDSKRFDEEDIMEINCALGNRTSEKQKVDFRSWIQDKSGYEYWSTSSSEQKIDAKSKAKVALPEVEFSEIELEKGQYYLKSNIKNKKGKCLHERTATFYYKQDPPLKGGWLKSIILNPLGGPHENLRNLPINKKGELLINLAYPELEQVWKSPSLNKRQKANAMSRVIINIALHEAVRELSLNWWQDKDKEFDIEEIKRSKDIFDEMWASYLRGHVANG